MRLPMHLKTGSIALAVIAVSFVASLKVMDFMSPRATNRPPALAELPPPLEPMAQADGSVASVLTVTDRMCKWPIGDPSDTTFAFCGRDACDGPYCTEHARLGFQPQRQRVRKAAAEPDELRRMLRYASM